MPVKRVDYYSDQDYEQAQQLEADGERQAYERQQMERQKEDKQYEEYYLNCQASHFIGLWYEENLGMIEDGIECRTIRY